jgi:hypothetical protein
MEHREEPALGNSKINAVVNWWRQMVLETRKGTMRAISNVLGHRDGTHYSVCADLVKVGIRCTYP